MRTQNGSIFSLGARVFPFLLVFACIGCALPLSQQPTTGTTTGVQSGSPYANMLGPEGIILAWNSPAAGDSVVSFEVACRDLQSTAIDWHSIAVVDTAPAPELILAYNSLSQGDWIVGVRAIDSAGTPSEWESSIDPTSIPTSGWIIRKL
jgi:hypothetical protein